jgi:putative DNA primase/helicase
MPRSKKQNTSAAFIELMTRPQWVAWRMESRGGRPAKVPHNPMSGGLASTGDLRTWGTYEQARSFSTEQAMDGVGYVFSAEDPYTGIDLDKCRDPETGATADWAQEIITALRSYTEISPSGTGVHIIVREALPSHSRRKGHIELYDSGRYFTMTGVRLKGTPLTIKARQVELDALHGHLWPAQAEPEPTRERRTPTATQRLTDDEVLGKALGAENGPKLARLWKRDLRAYDEDHSRVDLAICRLLAFYTRDPKQMDRLFRRSGLMRSKWRRRYGNGQTYGERTIQKTLAFSPAGHIRRLRAPRAAGGPRRPERRFG